MNVFDGGVGEERVDAVDLDASVVDAVGGGVVVCGVVVGGEFPTRGGSNALLDWIG